MRSVDIEVVTCMETLNKIPVIGISKLRVNQDGMGIRTLVASAECPLRCKYCINDICHNYPEDKVRWMSTDELYAKIKSHRLYFWASGGGVVFGGGEPLLYENFIFDFCSKYYREFYISIETSLAVHLEHLSDLKEMIHEFIVDIKTLDPVIYEKYTGVSNELLTENLKKLVNVSKKVIIRIPVIPGYTIYEECIRDIRELQSMGFSRFNEFKYAIV